MADFDQSSLPGKRNVCGCPGYLRLKLRWDDYYPALGAKAIVVKGELAGGVPMDSGSVRAEVVYPYPGWAIYQKIHILQPEADMRAGRAEFTLWADPDVTPQDLESIEIKFTYLVNDNDNGSVQGTWKVRNNSNVTFGEVLRGEAVFVFDEDTGVNHQGKTPANVIDYNERYFDFVQELLNQVVPRKRSVPLFYDMVGEDGIFDNAPDNSTVTAIYYLKEHFNIDNTSNIQWDFHKLMKDYNIPEVDYNLWHSKIVDKRLLIGDTLRIEGQALDNQINGIGGADTGLYELYVNVAKRFVDRMILEAERFSGQINPSGNDIPTQNWYARTGEGTQNSINPHGPGMSYCFGGKNSISQYNNSDNGVAHCLTPNPSQSKKFTLYYRQGVQVKMIASKKLINIDIANPMDVDSTYAGNVNETGCVLTGTKKYPGTHDYEYYSWLYGDGNHYRNYNMVTDQLTNPWPAIPQFNIEYWAGIDCSGLTQRSADSARNTVPGMNIAIPVPPNWIGSGEFFTNESITKTIPLPPDDTDENKQERNRILKKARKGDLLSYGNPIGHITIVYSERSQAVGNQVRFQIIHAYGTPIADINDDGAAIEFARKVVISPNRMLLPDGTYSLSNPLDFGRIKLWN